MWQNNKYKYNNISNTCSVADTTATGGILKTKNKRFKSVSYERTLEELNLCLGKALCSFNIKKLRYIRMRLSGLGRITIEALNMLKLDNVKNLQYEHHNIVSALSKTSLRSDLNSIFHVYNITVDTISCQEEIFMIPQDSFLAVNYVGNKIAIPKRIMDCEVLITFKPL